MNVVGSPILSPPPPAPVLGSGRTPDGQLGSPAIVRDGLVLSAAAQEPRPEPPTLLPAVQLALDGKLDGRRGGQCKVFVERQLGAHFPGKVGAKHALKPGNHPGFEVVSTPQPGDVFVMKSGSVYGHMGFVKRVEPDGTLVVVDSNWDDNERVKTHVLSPRTVELMMLGYLRPNGEQQVAYWTRPLAEQPPVQQARHKAPKARPQPHQPRPVRTGGTRNG